MDELLQDIVIYRVSVCIMIYISTMELNITDNDITCYWNHYLFNYIIKTTQKYSALRWPCQNESKNFFFQ